MVHVVYCDEKAGVLEKILKGSKTMIIRSASCRKIPHSHIFEGESLYFMKKGSRKITATASVKSVLNLINLTKEEISETLEKHQDKLNLSEKQKKQWHKKCICLVEFSDVTEITPLAFDQQDSMDDWIITEKIENVVVGTSIPYSFQTSRF